MNRPIIREVDGARWAGDLEGVPVPVRRRGGLVMHFPGMDEEQVTAMEDDIKRRSLRAHAEILRRHLIRSYPENGQVCRFESIDPLPPGAIRPGSIIELPPYDNTSRFKSLLRTVGRFVLDWFGPFLCLVTVFILAYQLGATHIRHEFSKYKPSQYFNHPGLLSSDEIQRMDNAFEEIRREVGK
jgi:hypothetical protein